MVSEPKIYAVLVESARGQVLHLGVHFSLEEAYAAARVRMESLTPHSKGEAMDIDLWNTMPARQAIAQLMDPSWANELVKLPESNGETPVDSRVQTGPVEQVDPQKLSSMLDSLFLKPATEEKQPAETTINDYVQGIKTKKNALMKKLIQDGDVAQVEKFKSVLGPYSRRYVLKQIENKNKN
jgi:hypothetical protein